MVNDSTSRRWAWRLAHPEHCRDYQRKWRNANPERVRKYMKAVNLKAYAYRDEVLKLYGNVCCKCGFADPRALHLDHVNGGGGKERKRMGTATIYKNAIAKVGDETYQLLCANCNWIKRTTAREVRLHSRHVPGEGEKVLGEDVPVPNQGAVVDQGLT